jgi:membrane protein required for colicin V production
VTPYDLFVALVILGSALLGWVRGGARELVTLVSFTLAALVALFTLPLTGPLFRQFIHPAWIGTVAAVVSVFVVSHFAIRAFGGWISRKLHQGDALGRLDRLGGLGFGLVRGLVLIGVFHLVFAAVTPPERLPGWFRSAALYPVSAGMAKTIQTTLPKGARTADRIAPALEATVRRGASDDYTTSPKSPRPVWGYSASERAGMDAQVEKSR